MRQIRSALTVLLLTSAILPPAAASTPGRWDAVRTDAFARLRELRDAVRPGSLGDTLRAAATLVGVRPLVPSARAASSPGSLPAPADVAVAELLGAIEGAGAAAGASLRAPHAEVEAAVARLDREIERSAGLLHPRSRLAELRALRGLDRFVDRPRLYGSAIALAEAIDRAIPALAGAATHGVGAPRGSRAGCDLVDQAPALCVGGLGANTYTGDYALVLDLGGDDLHAHSAGSADVQRNGLPASVTLDLGGNDRYATSVPSPTNARGVQGSGYIGGVGLLVDVLGNDTYRATTTVPVDQALAQGLGIAGVGVLADLAGDDDYGIRNIAVAAPDDSYNERANGQSYALLGGMSVVLEASGNDRYAVETLPAPRVDPTGKLHPGNPITLGFGYSALSGPAVFADLAGTDAARLAAVTEAVGADETRQIGAPSGTTGGVGLGGLGGAGVALTGIGSTTWDFATSVEAPTTGLATSGGGGFALLGGFGALQDAGGADLYRSTAVSRAVSHREVGDDCGCAGVAAEATSGGANATLGPVGLAGVGIVHEAGGSDRYELRGVGLAEAIAHDGRTPEVAVEGSASAVADLGIVATQGLGAGDLASAAFFLDDGGTPDAYTADSEADANASATTATPDRPVDETTSLSGAQSEVFGIGLITGYGEFVDIGGADTFAVANEARIDGTPVEGGLTSAMGSVRVGGTSAARFADLDGIGADTVTLVPDDPVCGGEPRTSGRYWQDCDGAGAGVRS